MMSYKSQLLSKADDYVFNLFKNSNTEKLLFHNYKHTYDVTQACGEIAEGSGLGTDDQEIIMLAGWFHDVGYLDSVDDHEEIGVKVAEEFLKNASYDTEKIEQVKSCIRATKISATPSNLLEEIICDADLKGLSGSSYAERTRLLKEEWAITRDMKMSEAEWLKMEVEFLRDHQYYTRYAQLHFNEKKSKNLVDRQLELQKFSKKADEKGQKKKQKEKELSLKAQKSNIPEKGIETMFRTALKNHMELSSIADNKANTMLSINALVLSIIISSLFPKFDKHPELLYPTVFMLIICLVSIVLATLSTKPKITAGLFSVDDVENRKTNLLFFGNFHNMDLKQYEWGMKEIMRDKEYLYSSLIRDLHSLGVVLAKKYRFLRWCYLIFMFGMISTVVGFGIAILSQSSAIDIAP